MFLLSPYKCSRFSVFISANMMILIVILTSDSHPAHAKDLPSSSTRMHSMLGMLSLRGEQFKWNEIIFLGQPIELLTWDNFRGYRLTTNYIEPISFTVPRVKSTFFQVQFFPAGTKIDGNAKMTSLKAG